MKLWPTLAVFVIAIGLSAPTNAGSKSARFYPKAVRGVWMSDDTEGHSQCQKYASSDKAGRKKARNYPAGILNISRKIWISQNDQYGGDNSYRAETVTELGNESWAVSAESDSYVYVYDLGIYVPAIADFSVSLADGKLIWSIEEVGGEHRYFRCADPSK